MNETETNMTATATRSAECLCTRLFDLGHRGECGLLEAGRFQRAHQQRIDRKVRELASDLADLVASGDLTEEQANQWMTDKQDAWSVA